MRNYLWGCAFGALALLSAPSFATSDATPAQPELEQSVLDQIDAQIDAKLTELMAPTGAPITDWNTGGVNIDQLIANAGIEPAMLVGIGDEPSIRLLPTTLDSAFTPEWRLSRTTRMNEGKPTGFLIAPLTPTLAFVVGMKEQKNGTADCGTPVEIRHYATADHNSNDEEATYIVSFIERFTAKLGKLDACTNYLEVRPGVYRARSYTSKGEPLGKVDAEVTDETIRPVSELLSILARTARGEAK